MTRRAMFAVLVLLVIPLVGSIDEDEGKEWAEVAGSSIKFESKVDYFVDIHVIYYRYSIYRFAIVGGQHADRFSLGRAGLAGPAVSLLVACRGVFRAAPRA